MEELSDHPITIPLFKSTEANLKSFEVVHTNLQQKFYTNISEWINDLNEALTLFSFNEPPNSPKTLIAEQVRKMISKLMIPLNNISTDFWCKSVIHYQFHLSKLLNYYPKHSNSGENETPHESTISEEIKELVKAVSSITSDDDHHEMIQIVTNLQPELETCNLELLIDVTMLKPETLLALKEFVAKVIARDHKIC